MPTTPRAVYDKRREHHAARTKSRGRCTCKGGVGHKRCRKKRPLQPTRAACLLQGALDHKPYDGKMTSRNSNEMRRSRHRKPFARRLSAQLGRTSADNAGNERARRIGRGSNGGKKLISQPKQRPWRAPIDRHNPDSLNLAQLTPKHARTPIRIILEARNAADDTHARPSTELAIAR